MAKTNLFARITALVLAATASLVFGCVAEAPPESDEEENVAEVEQALPPQGCRWAYFSDSSYSTMVGRCIWGCGGGHSCTGTQTDYVLQDCWECFDEW